MGATKIAETIAREVELFGVASIEEATELSVSDEKFSS
jgi:alanine racemase